MLSIYIAARYSRKEEIKTCAEQARAAGMKVTSSWLQEPHAPGTQLRDMTANALRKYAIQDKDDVKAADVLVFFSEDPERQPPRGGRHVELGMALAWGKRVYVIGGKENIFHYHPAVTVVPFWSEALAQLKELKK